MLASTLGIRILLLLGPAVPRPPSVELMNALASVEVTNDSEGADGFQLTFACGRTGLGDYGLVQSGDLAPMTRVIIAVIFGFVPEVLIDGVITHSQFDPGAAPGQARLTVTGRDLSALLDLEEKDESFENQPDTVIVARIVAKYARYGIVPRAAPTTDVPIMLERIPRQHETDLRFIQRLAQRNGFVFYLEPLTVGVTVAVWGPQPRAGLPQPALTINQGAATNVNSHTFSYDSLAATGTRGAIVEPFLKLRIPIPALPSLKLPPLAAEPAAPLRTTIQREAANQNPATAATRALASVTNAPDAARAEGELDGVRYGTALRARRLVGVRGAGLKHDGFWYVGKVTHRLVREGYTQRFTLSREGTGTLTPIVRP